MLTISKPTLFAPDGFALRGQCNHDSPGWQLRWFNRGDPLAVIWQGSFKTCRHLQFACADATTLPEVEQKVAELLKSDSFTNFTSLPTDIYPAAHEDDSHSGESETQARKRRKRKRK